MNRSGKRLAFTVAGAAIAALSVLSILHREGIRDHVEAWRFQLLRETKTLEPGEDPVWLEAVRAGADDHDSLHAAVLLQVLANSSGTPVIVDQARFWEWYDLPRGKREFTKKTALEAAREAGLRVLEQRFPRRAYVVVSDHPGEDLDETEELGRILDEIEREAAALGPPEPAE